MIPLTKIFKHWTYEMIAPGTLLKEKYEAFKALLRNDKRALELLAELEEIYHDQIKVDFNVIENKYDELSRCVSEMVVKLNNISPSRYLDLRDYFEKFDSYVRFMLEPPAFNTSPPFTIPIEKISSDSQAMVGSKALNLAIIGKDLQLPVPSGFVITSNAFHYLLESNDLRKSIDEKLSKLDVHSGSSLNALSHGLVNIVKDAEIPPEIEEAILSTFRSSHWDRGENVILAMRSSAVGEDTRASFAGQYRTVLNVKEENILDAYKEVIASKYEPNALYYRINYGLSDRETPMAVIALEMVDAKASGITYTKNLETPESNNLVIHSIWGLGDLLASGELSPDIIEVKKEPKARIAKRKPGDKDKQMVFTKEASTEIIPVEEEERRTLSLDDESALALTEWGMRLEGHYKQPQDIEWCMDKEGYLFVLQSRPLQSGEKSDENSKYSFEDVSNAVLVSGGETACSGCRSRKSV
jgi:pyruvate,water dikinase